jgi:hypothetical protein
MIINIKMQDLDGSYANPMEKWLQNATDRHTDHPHDQEPKPGASCPSSCFIAELTKYLHQEATWLPELSILTQNSKIIGYLANRPHYPSLFCNATLTNDWDILEQIHSITAKTPLKVTWWETIPTFQYCHLQSPVPPFNFKQTIADTRNRTRTFLQLHPERHPFGPFLPASQCMVYTTTSTIHSKYTLNFRKSATVPPLLEYLKDKYTWSTETTNLIHWPWFRQAVNNYKAATGNHLTKLIFNQLATKTRKAKAGGQRWLNPICPHCQTQQETFDHLLRCDNPDAITFQIQLPKDIAHHCNRHHVPESFIQFLLIAVDKWIVQAPMPDDP